MSWSRRSVSTRPRGAAGPRPRRSRPAARARAVSSSSFSAWARALRDAASSALGERPAPRRSAGGGCSCSSGVLEPRSHVDGRYRRAPRQAVRSRRGCARSATRRSAASARAMRRRPPRRSLGLGQAALEERAPLVQAGVAHFERSLALATASSAGDCAAVEVGPGLAALALGGLGLGRSRRPRAPGTHGLELGDAGAARGRTPLGELGDRLAAASRARPCASRRSAWARANDSAAGEAGVVGVEACGSSSLVALAPRRARPGRPASPCRGGPARPGGQPALGTSGLVERGAGGAADGGADAPAGGGRNGRRRGHDDGAGVQRSARACRPRLRSSRPPRAHGAAEHTASSSRPPTS